MPNACRRGRSRTAWMDNIKMWTTHPVEESIRMTEINGESKSMVLPTPRSRTAKEQKKHNCQQAVQSTLAVLLAHQFWLLLTTPLCMFINNIYLLTYN